ncbi:MAG: hypothetical protein WKG01_08220 [Kofleriaceae bacterium]
MTDHKPGTNPHDVISIKPPSAKQVAKELDRRRTRRKIGLVILLIGAIILAIVYGTCGGGWGFGKGKGDGAGSGPGSGPGSGQGLVAEPIDAGPRRCSVFIASEGITVEGRQMTRDEAVSTCKTAGAGADVIVAGDVVQKDWDELRDALSIAGVEVFTRESPNTGSGGSGSGSDPGSDGSAGSDTSGSDAGGGSG